MIFENKKLKVIEKENEQLRNQFNEAAITIERVTSGELEQSLLNENGQNNLLTENIEKLRNRLLTLSKEEKQRLWATQGLANFVDLLRGHQNGNDFYDNVISDLVKYLGANQGGLFVIEESGPNKVQLELKACYAFSRKKFLEKTILPGEGLVGQCFLEKETIYLTEVPNGYVHITSGLGDANPRSILIVPLKSNDEVVGIIELASFSVFEKHKIDFVEKLSESIASTIANIKSAERTQLLLMSSQEGTEELRAQEEELRQNMEEMAAIQEDLDRQLKIMKDMKGQLEVRERVFGITTILSEADTFGTITYVNDKLCEVSKFSRDELIGQGHNIFRHPDMPKELFKKMWESIKQGKVFQGIVKNRTKDGSHYWVDASIVPVLDSSGKVTKFIGARYHIKDDFLAETLWRKQLETL